MSQVAAISRTRSAFGDVALSRSDVVGAANSVAERVRGADRVAVLATPTAPTALAIAGCLIAGVPVVPVPADVGQAERRHILSDSGAQAWLGPAPDAPGGCRTSRCGWARGPGISNPSRRRDDTALIIYTSGTTGLPKGVQLSGQAIAADLDALAEAWQWTADDTLVHGLPLFHVHGLVLGLLGSLRVGNRFVHTGKPTPAAYASRTRHAVFRRADGVVAGGGRPRGRRSAALQRDCWCRAARACRCRCSTSWSASPGIAPVERYGASESLITLSTRADGERRPGWVGLPLTGIETRLVDDDGEAVPHDAETIGDFMFGGRRCSTAT